jgi:dihydroorotate dehydrogenase
MSVTIPTKFVISPPFGGHVCAPRCTRILGSYTWNPRPGVVFHTMRTLRPINGGWVNRIGLRNCGLQNVQFQDQHIYSLVGFDDGDWEQMLQFCPTGLRVEINLGCPNVHDYGIDFDVLTAYCRKFRVIVKLPPTVTAAMIARIVLAGADHLHLCNTLPSPQGGISGRQLQPMSQALVCSVARLFPNVTIIAGGGIYSPRDVDAYARAGADHFSLSTIWFSPWRVPGVLMH